MSTSRSTPRSARDFPQRKRKSEDKRIRWLPAESIAKVRTWNDELVTAGDEMQLKRRPKENGKCPIWG
jgi:hypothetical protein